MKKFYIILFCIFGAGSLYASNVTIDGIRYDFSEDSDTASVHDGRTCSGNVIIPSSISYNNQEYTVTSIDRNAFGGCTGLLSISLPNTIKFIDESAFSGCCNLQSIVIPENVTRLKRSTFAFCSSVVSISLPESLEHIESYAFENCTNLSKIVIPDNVDTIEDHAFNSCISLTKVQLSNNLTEISDYLFNSCNGLQSINIPQSVQRFGYGSFFYCTNLRYVNIPDNVTSINYATFFNCVALDTIDCYLNTPLSIYSTTLYYVPETCKLIINDGTKSLWENALYWKDLTIIERNGVADGLEDIDRKQSHEHRKIFLDGQILIQRGNKTYTITGAEVK